jgi:hypothetical protein
VSRRTTRRWQPIVGLGCLLAACLLSGCAAAVLAGAAAGAGVGTAVYVEGEHSQVHTAGLDRTWTATMATLQQMDLQVEQQQKDELGGNIEAKRVDGTSVTIKEEPVGTATTRVRIRVGTFGDQQASEAIQKRIDANLRA